jgi:predicted molibdopterin-dependent oxidoreductase YjgC
MFRRLDQPVGATVRLTLDGEAIEAMAGDSVAAALLAADAGALRTTPASGEPRAAYCMIGVCFDCLVTIDGAANRQACMATVRDGMCVERKHGARQVIGAIP